MTSYRTFRSPGAVRWDTHHWSRWLVDPDQHPGLYVPVQPFQQGVCDMCLGPTLLAPDGDPYRRCINCRRAFDEFAGLVPISYSWAKGLESAVYWAKSGDQWLNIPLASLLHRFLTAHLPCIEARFGSIDIITMLPSHAETRGGSDHMRMLHASVSAWPAPALWNLDLLSKNDPSRAGERRGQAIRTLFSVRDDVQDRRVLLIDDTWTSGGSMYSAGAALRDAGARKPVCLTLGRQFHPEDDRTAAWRDTLDQGVESDITEICSVHLGRGSTLTPFGIQPRTSG